MIITQINKTDVEVKCETIQDKVFWQNIKTQLAQKDETIKALKKEIKHLKGELHGFKQK